MNCHLILTSWKLKVSIRKESSSNNFIEKQRDENIRKLQIVVISQQWTPWKTPVDNYRINSWPNPQIQGITFSKQNVEGVKCEVIFFGSWLAKRHFPDEVTEIRGSLDRAYPSVRNFQHLCASITAMAIMSPSSMGLLFGDAHAKISLPHNFADFNCTKHTI